MVEGRRGGSGALTEETLDALDNDDDDDDGGGGEDEDCEQEPGDEDGTAAEPGRDAQVVRYG